MDIMLKTMDKADVNNNIVVVTDAMHSQPVLSLLRAGCFGGGGSWLGLVIGGPLLARPGCVGSMSTADPPPRLREGALDVLCRPAPTSECDGGALPLADLLSRGWGGKLMDMTGAFCAGAELAKYPRSPVHREATKARDASCPRLWPDPCAARCVARTPAAATCEGCT